MKNILHTLFPASQQRSCLKSQLDCLFLIFDKKRITKIYQMMKFTRRKLWRKKISEVVLNIIYEKKEVKEKNHR